jgi:hypothetical protein
MKKLPTAEEFFKIFQDFPKYMNEANESDVAKVMIQFAKLHCEAQLKAILEKVRVREDELSPVNTEKVENTYIGIEFEVDKGYEDYCPYKYTVDKDSIINAYDLNQIK